MGSDWERSLARKWRCGRYLWNVDWCEGQYGMLECQNSGGCAGLGNLYIFTVVVVMSDMSDDSN